MKPDDVERLLTPTQREMRQQGMNSLYRVDGADGGVRTFWAYDKWTGERLLVDARTFDPTKHETLNEPPPAA